MVDVIRTTKNKTYKFLKSLQTKKARTENGCFTVEGIKSVSDAVLSGCRIRLAVLSESLYTSGEFEVHAGLKFIVVDDNIFGGLCDTKTPQGVLAVIETEQHDGFRCDPDKLYIYCDNISDPGNLGTIIRTADAAGLGGVLLSPGCTDLYSPKTVRASMGSFFNISVIPAVSYDALVRIKEHGFSLYAGALQNDSSDYRTPDYTKPAIIIIGNEANGVSEEILEISEHIIIPIYGSAESLNAAVAGAIIMYEAAGQRRKSDG